MEIEQQVWGFTSEGEAIILYTMSNDSGESVRLTNVGAAIVGITVPDRDGVIDDVALGYQDPLSYIGDGPCMGKIPGRYANRIARGLFSLDGVEYRLPQNNAGNHLHGGNNGFANKLWESSVEGDRVVFKLMSSSGDQGYPAELHAEVVYGWNNACELSIRMLAKSDAPTVVNLTNHTYFNLGGENSGSIVAETLKLNADKYLPTDSTLIPTGVYADVEGTPMDFRQTKALGRDIDADFDAIKFGGGYDACFVVENWTKGQLCDVGVLTDTKSGRVMKIASTQPAVQVYTANYMQGAPIGKSGRAYDNRDGVAIECQGMPDAPNQPNFPSQRLDPGELYDQTIVYSFSIL